jgi:hypothetical protein
MQALDTGGKQGSFAPFRTRPSLQLSGPDPMHNVRNINLQASHQRLINPCAQQPSLDTVSQVQEQWLRTLNMCPAFNASSLAPNTAPLFPKCAASQDSPLGSQALTVQESVDALRQPMYGSVLPQAQTAHADTAALKRPLSMLHTHHLYVTCNSQRQAQSAALSAAHVAQATKRASKPHLRRC